MSTNDTINSDNWKNDRDRGLKRIDDGYECDTCHDVGVFRDDGELYTCEDCVEGFEVFDMFKAGNIGTDDLFDMIEEYEEEMDERAEDEESSIFYTINTTPDLTDEELESIYKNWCNKFDDDYDERLRNM